MREKRARKLIFGRAILAALLLVTLAPSGVQAGSDAEQGTVEEILQILADRGILTEAEHLRLATKIQTARSEKGARDVAARLLEGLEWHGDLRLRYEAFWFDSDSRGVDGDNRYRFRYRARLGFKKKLNDWLNVAMRFGSGEDDHRSANRTFGRDADFGPDPLFIDRVYAEFTLPEYDGLKTKIHAGKVPNPFVWKHGKDLLIIEKDVNPEGASLLANRALSERTRLFFNAGGYVAAENSTNKDPKLFAAQIGGTSKISEEVEVGLRFSHYEWRSLDEAFILRDLARGNLLSAFDERARIGSVSGFARFECSDAWPIELYGTYIRNLLADPAVIEGFPEDEQDTAWGAGFEIGSSSKWVKLGISYFYVEANAVVARFIDSDLFEGFTNRRGWYVYASKKLAPGLEFKVEFFDSDSIENAAGYLTSVANADRKRFRTDLVLSY